MLAVEYRLWLAAGTTAVALHAAVWLALHHAPMPAAPHYLQFSVVEAQFAAASAKAVATPTVPKRKPRRERAKTRRVTKRRVTKRRVMKRRVTKRRTPATPRPTPPPPQPAKPVVAAVTPVAAPDPYVEPDYGAAYLHNPPPIYPLMARRRGISGRVVIEAEVTADGRCGAARVLHSSGHEILDDTALAAVKKWRFVPATRNGHPVTATVEIPLNFKLQGEG